MGVVAADIDDDGLIDLFVSNDTTANYLWAQPRRHEVRRGRSLKRGRQQRPRRFQAGMGTAVGDLDGDGLPDLTVTNDYGESTDILPKLGKGHFRRPDIDDRSGAPSRYLVGFGIVLFDADNDGRLDLGQNKTAMLTTTGPTSLARLPGLLLIARDSGHLVDVTSEAGPAWSVPRLGRALAAGDLDNDGRIDLISVPQNTPLVFFRNQTKSGSGHAVSFLLEGSQSQPRRRRRCCDRHRRAAPPPRLALWWRQLSVGWRSASAFRSGAGSHRSGRGSLAFGSGRSLQECRSRSNIPIARG